MQLFEQFDKLAQHQFCRELFCQTFFIPLRSLCDENNERNRFLTTFKYSESNDQIHYNTDNDIYLKHLQSIQRRIIHYSY